MTEETMPKKTGAIAIKGFASLAMLCAAHLGAEI